MTVPAGNMTDASMQAFVLRRLRASAIFLSPYEKLKRKLLKQSLDLFGSADNAVRVQAILFIRQLALVLPQPALDLSLKVLLPGTDVCMRTETRMAWALYDVLKGSRICRACQLQLQFWSALQAHTLNAVVSGSSALSTVAVKAWALV